VSESEKPVFVRGRVPESLRARFKATCALEGRDMSDVLKELIENWLEENEKPLPAKKSKGNP
jgi:predicted DNA-binding protein